MQWARRQQGFTIVELLIVIVVIAILAAITIVSYNGITKKASESIAQSNTEQVVKKVKIYLVQNNDAYPASLSDLGFVSNDTTSYQYSTSADGFCATVTVKGIAYYAGENFSYTSGGTTQTLNQGSPAAGACPGHSTNGVAVTANLMTNPGVETDTSGYGKPNASDYSVSTTRVHSGTKSLLVTMPANAAGGNVGISMLQNNSFLALGLEPSTKYTVSAWVYIPSSNGSAVSITVQGAGRNGNMDDPAGFFTGTKNTWIRLRNTFTTKPTDGKLTFYVLNYGDTPATSAQFYVDDMMLSKGDNTYGYADGNTAGWVWSGTQNKSTSSGPAIVSP